MTNRENYLRTINFNYPQWIPVSIGINFLSMIEHKQDMESVLTKFPEFFPGFKAGTVNYSQYGDGSIDIVENDTWGYKWHYRMVGIEGCVIDPPIDDWSKFDTYQAPDSDIYLDKGGKRDWETEFAQIAAQKQSGEPVTRGLIHGFMFLRLQYLRGFENLMMDMFDEEPKLFELTKLIDRENLKVVKKYCEANVDVMLLPEDIGAQNSMIISREMFQKYIIPSYRKLILPCKQNDIKVAIHSDGYILDILDDLIEVGMDIINPQDLCNGIDNLAKALKGKVSIQLDLDRVQITPSGTRNEIFELIEQEVKMLGSKEGGLEFVYGVYPPTGPDQVAYVCEAFRKYRTYWSEK